MKIQIIGCSGTGKTYLAKALAEKYQIPRLDLDDIFWDNREGAYGKKYDEATRHALLSEYLSKESWIIEGVYYKWTAQVFEDATAIYVLEIPRRVYLYRIIKRFLKRKLHLEEGKGGSIRSLVALVRWTKKYQNVHMVEIQNILTNYEDKLHYLRSTEEIDRLIEKGIDL